MNLWLHKSEKAESSASDIAMKKDAIAVLRGIFDPEIPVNIYDLGLVYGIEVNAATGRVDIRMTLTAPGCPVARTFPEMVAQAVAQVPGIIDVRVELVWEPPWSQEMMTEAARLQLGLL